MPHNVVKGLKYIASFRPFQIDGFMEALNRMLSEVGVIGMDVRSSLGASCAARAPLEPLIKWP